jgi:hypothetical protein
MPLRRQTAFFLLILATAACTEPSEPPSISAQFILTDVDGQSLPADSPPTAGTPGPTIVSGTMTLDFGGTAVIAEDRIESNGTHDSIVTHYVYSIKDGQITFSYALPCGGINANCPVLPTGQILDNGLKAQLVFPPGYTFQVYNYRISATL